MSEEIKEKIKAYYIANDIDKILNYITNLQQKVEELETIRKKAITYILANCEIIRHKKENVDEVGRVNGADLLNILSKGDNNVKDKRLSRFKRIRKV